LNAIVDRSRREAALALSAAWLAFLGGLLLGGEIEDAPSIALAGAGAAVLVFLGFAAASRCRTPPPSSNAHRTRRALLSLVAGTALGTANLAANWLIAQSHPALRALLAERVATLGPLPALVASPIVEEMGLRLFLMSALAWVASRFTKRAELAFAIALVGSALFFALLHLDRPVPNDALLTTYYRAALVTKYTLAGLPLGWIFWRWGLPYAILCHVAANAAHLALQGRVF